MVKVKFTLFLFLLVFHFGNCKISETCENENQKKKQQQNTAKTISNSEGYRDPSLSPNSSTVPSPMNLERFDSEATVVHEFSQEDIKPYEENYPDKLIHSGQAPSISKVHLNPRDTLPHKTVAPAVHEPKESLIISNESGKKEVILDSKIAEPENRIVSQEKKVHPPQISSKGTQTPPAQTIQNVNQSSEQDLTVNKTSPSSAAAGSSSDQNVQLTTTVNSTSSSLTTTSHPSVSLKSVTSSSQTDPSHAEDPAIVDKVTKAELSDDDEDDEDFQVAYDKESTRSMLIKLQKVLLVIAGVTFLCILIYSVYYINLIRSIYSKEKVVK